MVRSFSAMSSCFLVSCLGLGLLANPAYARFPLPPRLSALAYASDYTVGQADLMLPMWGDASRNLYVDPALSYGTDNQNEGDVGLGYRWIANQAAILGAYLYGGYSRIDNNARLWIVNPGIETLGSRWDAHLNAYFPMGDRHANDGIAVSTYFTGHSQLGNLFVIDQYAGNGADAKVGYQLFPGSSLKAYLGSYYFSPAQTNNVWGGAAGLEYWLTKDFKMIGSYTYDNLHHSTYAFGIGLEWGGTRVHRTDPALEERLTDPVERNLAELGHGSKIPSRIKNQAMGVNVVFANNIAFFSQTGGGGGLSKGLLGLSLANCTFESPCGPTDFTQANVTSLGALLPNTQFYFNGGTYTSSSILNLVPGQSVQSRTANYSQAATGAARSIITNSTTINLQGNNTLQNIILLPSSVLFDTRINIFGANNTITGSQIGSSSFRVTRGVIDSGRNTLINNSQIFAVLDAYAVTAGNVSSVIRDSGLNVVSLRGIAPAGITITGSNSNITINNTQIQVNNPLNEFESAYGLMVLGPGSTVNINDSSITVTSNAPSGKTFVIATSDATTVVNGGDLNASSIGFSVGIVDSTFPGNTTIQDGTICQVDGATVVCQ